MIQSIIDQSLLIKVYPEVKFWVSLCGSLWAIFKGVSWVKDIRDKDLVGLKADVATANSELTKQTETIASGFNTLQSVTDRGFRDLRDDFRTFYMAPDPVMAPARARKSQIKPKAAKSKAKVKSNAKTKK